MGRKCDCCKERNSMYVKGNLHLCRVCKDVDYEKIAKLVTLRREQEVDQAISELI